MPEVPYKLSNVSPDIRRWLWTARLAVLAAFMVGAHATYVDLVWLMVTLPFLCLYPLVFLGLCGKPSRTGLQLAQATGWAGFICVMFAIPVVASGDKFEARTVCLLGLITLAQLALGVGAVQVSRLSNTRERGGIQETLATVLLGVFLIVLVLASSAVVPGTLRSRQAAMEASAARSLKTLGACAAAYREGHPQQGFPASLAMLGPEGQNCINEELATGVGWHYEISYTPGTPDAGGHINDYVTSARPLKDVRSGQMSYYSDESGVIHLTGEDRAATAEDPPIGT